VFSSSHCSPAFEFEFPQFASHFVVILSLGATAGSVKFRHVVWSQQEPAEDPVSHYSGEETIPSLQTGQIPYGHIVATDLKVSFESLRVNTVLSPARERAHPQSKVS
jgi:hypothetical protein